MPSGLSKPPAHLRRYPYFLSAGKDRPLFGPRVCPRCGRPLEDGQEWKELRIPEDNHFVMRWHKRQCYPGLAGRGGGTPCKSCS
jgi:hypothetical protein